MTDSSRISDLLCWKSSGCTAGTMSQAQGELKILSSFSTWLMERWGDTDLSPSLSPVLPQRVSYPPSLSPLWSIISRHQNKWIPPWHFITTRKENTHPLSGKTCSINLTHTSTELKSKDMVSWMQCWAAYWTILWSLPLASSFICIQRRIRRIKIYGFYILVISNLCLYRDLFLLTAQHCHWAAAQTSPARQAEGHITQTIEFRQGGSFLQILCEPLDQTSQWIWCDDESIHSSIIWPALNQISVTGVSSAHRMKRGNTPRIGQGILHFQAHTQSPVNTNMHVCVDTSTQEKPVCKFHIDKPLVWPGSEIEDPLVVRQTI